jgi:predicted restriction endonuclease
MSGIKRTRADAEFSKAVRVRDRWMCQRCGVHYMPPTRALHCAHYFTRRTQVTRLDLDNALALCYGCHQYLDSHPVEKEAFWRQAIGDERFDALAARAHGRRDR